LGIGCNFLTIAIPRGNGAFDWKCCQSGKHFSQNKNHRRREIAKKLGPLGLTWSCNSRANLDYDTIKSFKDNGPRLFLVG